MMFHHYLHRGHRLRDLINLEPDEKLFMQISMELYYEQEKNKWGGVSDG